MATKKTQAKKRTTTKSKKTTARKKNQNISFYEQFNQIIKDNRTKLLLAGLFAFLAIFMFLAFISYMVNWPEDQSQFDSPTYVSSSGVPVENSDFDLVTSLENNLEIPLSVHLSLIYRLLNL